MYALSIASLFLGGLGSLLHHAAADLAHVLLQRRDLHTATYIESTFTTTSESHVCMYVCIYMYCMYVCTVCM